MSLNIKNLIKESIADYLAELNTEREEVQEETTLEENTSEFEDKVTKDGNIYLVLKPTKDMSEGGIVNEVSLKSLIGEGYIGAYLAGPQALIAGKKALKARDAKLKETIEVGKSKVTELEAKIEELKRQIEDNSTRAVHDPQRRGELTETNDSLFTQLEKIENAVEKLKVALDKESPKKAKKEEKEDINEGDPNAVYYLVKSASTGKYLVRMASKHASQTITGNQKFKSESEAQKEADKRNKKEDVNEGSLSNIENQLLDAPIGSKATGGGYGPFKKVKQNTWKNLKAGSLNHSQALANHIGGFDDFKIEKQ